MNHLFKIMLQHLNLIQVRARPLLSLPIVFLKPLRGGLASVFSLSITFLVVK